MDSIKKKMITLSSATEEANARAERFAEETRRISEVADRSGQNFNSNFPSCTKLSSIFVHKHAFAVVFEIFFWFIYDALFLYFRLGNCDTPFFHPINQIVLYFILTFFTFIIIHLAILIL